ncbi:MFS general substrate transporter [Mycena amicta]|nr:MFS general substrate transporter [Mycena amicta]
MSQLEEVELAVRIPLPSSTSTLGIIEDSSIQASGSPLQNSSLLVNESSLPPTDRGLGAWSFLAAAFFVEAIVWGFPNAYGVFLDSYLKDPRFASQNGATRLLPLVGTLSSGIIYCSGVVLNPISARYPQHRRKSMWFGSALSCASLFSASYATTISQLIVLQGILYAVGGAILYLACISFLSEWFIVRRGTANGILFAGTAAGGLVLPLTLPHLISKYGTSKTLRILAIAIGVLLLLLVPFVKGRLPQTRTRIRGPAPRGLRDWFKQRGFWVFFTVNTLQALAYFIPIVYLPTFASNLDINASNSAVTLAMLNGASVVGRLSMGYLSDKINFWILALVTLLTTSAATFVLWGVLSHSFGGLLAFGIVYGSIAGGWSSLWTGFVRPLAKDDATTSTALYGYLLLSRGIGNIVSTPISARLYAGSNDSSHSHGPTHPTGFEVGDGRFKSMILYVGTCFAGAAVLAAVGWAMDSVQKKKDAKGAKVQRVGNI